MLTCLHPEDETSGLKHIDDIIKIKISVQQGAYCCFMLYDYITMHGAENIKFNLLV